MAVQKIIDNKKFKILLVEDDVFMQEELSREFVEQGFEVIIAGNGEDGLEKIMSERPDLILLDLLLPQMNGFDLLKKMKDDDSIPQIRTIVLSNLERAKDIEQAQALGSLEYLIKAHHTPAEIAARVKKILGA